MTSAIETRRREFAMAASCGLYAGIVAIVPQLWEKAILAAPLVLVPLGWWLLRKPNRWPILFFAAAWLLPPLPIEIGNSGPHVAVLAVAIGLFVGLLRAREWRLKIDAALLSICALFAVLLSSVALASIYSGLEVAAGSLARVLLLGISVYLFLYVRDGPALASRTDSAALIRGLYFIAVGSALFAIIDFYYQFPTPAGYGAQFVWLDTGVFRRAQGFFYEASTLGNFCAFFLAMIAVDLFRAGGTRMLPVWASVGGAAILTAALVLSYSRASLLNVGVALGALVWLQRRRIGGWRVWIAAATVALSGLLAMAKLSPDFSRLYWLRITTSLQYFFVSPDAVLSGRLRSWAFLQNFLTDRPWHALLGIGYKTLPYSDFAGAAATADNTYLGLLVETGIPGLLALFALHAAILRGSLRAARSANSTQAFLGTWIFCFWCGEVLQMFSGDLLTYWRVLPAYFCVFALATRAHPRPA